MRNPEAEIRVLVESFAAAMAAVMEAELHETFQAENSGRRIPATASIGAANAGVARSLTSKASRIPPVTSAVALRNLAQIALGEIDAAVDDAGEPTKITLKQLIEVLQVDRSRAESVVRFLVKRGHVARHGTGDGWFAIASWKPKAVGDGEAAVVEAEPESLESRAKPKHAKAKPMAAPLDGLAEKILRLLSDNQHGAVRVTDALLASTYKASRATIGKTMRGLIDSGRVVTEGNGRSAWYRLAGDGEGDDGEVEAVAVTKKARRGAAKVVVVAAPADAVGDGGEDAEQTDVAAAASKRSKAAKSARTNIEAMVEAGLKARLAATSTAS